MKFANKFRIEVHYANGNLICSIFVVGGGISWIAAFLVWIGLIVTKPTSWPTYFTVRSMKKDFWSEFQIIFLSSILKLLERLQQNWIINWHEQNFTKKQRRPLMNQIFEKQRHLLFENIWQTFNATKAFNESKKLLTRWKWFIIYFFSLPEQTVLLKVPMAKI